MTSRHNDYDIFCIISTSAAVALRVPRRQETAMTGVNVTIVKGGHANPRHVESRSRRKRLGAGADVTAAWTGGNGSGLDRGHLRTANQRQAGYGKMERRHPRCRAAADGKPRAQLSQAGPNVET